MGPSTHVYGASRLVSFRRLCNLAKTVLIHRAVQGCKACKPLSVVDLGVGAGGDLTKWHRYRLHVFVGVDKDACRLEAARGRLAGLSTVGQTGGVQSVRLVAMDLSQPSTSPNQWFESMLGRPASLGVSIVSVLLSLPLILCGGPMTPALFVDHVDRLLAPGGIFVVMMSDTAIARQKLQILPRATFGHFCLQQRTPNNKYAFKLPGGMWTEESMIDTPALVQALKQKGYVSLLSDGAWWQSAQEMVLRAEPRGLVAQWMGSRYVSDDDWMSLGFFGVLLCQKPTESESPTSQKSRGAS